jgi:subtilisin family serine protease
MKKFLLAALLLAGVICAAGTSPLLVPPIAAAAEHSLSSEPISIRMDGDRLSLDIRDADIARVLGEIAAQAGISITVGDGIAGRVSLQLTEASVEEVLKVLCQSQALVYEVLPEKNTYRVIQALALPATEETGRAGTTAATGDGIAGKKAAAAVSGPGAAGTPAAPKTLSPLAPSPGGIHAPHAAADSRTGDPERLGYKPRELLVTFKEGVSTEAIDALHRSLGSTVLRNIPKLHLQRVKLKEDLSEEEAQRLYKADEIVEDAERHTVRYPQLVTNDPSFSKQWALTKIKAPEAWDLTQGSQDVVVAVIDSGIDYTHPDLADNIWINEAELNGQPGVDDDNNGYVDDIRGWDFAGSHDIIDTDGDNDPITTYDHGTHLAGIVAARGNNSLGIAGINWRLRIMPLKVMADDNEGNFNLDAIALAIKYAIDNGAKIIICSFGSSNINAKELAGFTKMQEAGIIAACAAGNGGGNNDVTHNYPSDYDLDNIISVAASDSNDHLASSSNYGATSVDLMAPGVNIYSTIPSATTEALVRVEGPVPVDYTALGMAYAGTTGAGGITGTLYNCGQGYPGQFPAGVNGNIALIQRSIKTDSFTFKSKVQNAQATGAAGVVVYNHLTAIEDDGFDTAGGTLGEAGTWVPVVSLTRDNGQALLQSDGQTVTLINKPTIKIDPYNYKSGTSMAAPHVAGVAGLILSHCPSLGFEAVKAAILNSVDKIPAVSDQLVTGGSLNAFAALKAALPPGDLSGNCRVGIEDAVLALQLLAGLPTGSAYPCPACGGDLDGDAKIGLPETLFILQKTAGLR